MLLLFWLYLSGRAGPLLIKGNKLLRSPGAPKQSPGSAASGRFTILRVILAHKASEGGLAEGILRVILMHKAFEGGLAEGILRVILAHKASEGGLAEGIFFLHMIIF